MITPGLAVVRGSDQPKLVAVVSGVPPVVPGGDYLSLWSDGQRRHPLRAVATGRRVAVEGNWSRPGGAVVIGANVEDVAQIARVGPACGVDIVNYSPRTHCRFAPAHVPPHRSHRREITTHRLARRSKRRPLLNLRPSDAAVQRPIDVVDSVVDAAAALVHPGDEHRSGVGQASGELERTAESSPAIDAHVS